MTEGDKHYKAKLRARQILMDYLGCENCSIEKEQQGESFGAEKNWSLDAYGELTIKIGIEIDGKTNHGTKITIPKDKFRDKDNLERNKVYTVRFKPDDFIGKKSLTREQIIDEIRYRLKKQGLPLLQEGGRSSIIDPMFL